jgi:hypothetical protein
MRRSLDVIDIDDVTGACFHMAMSLACDHHLHAPHDAGLVALRGCEPSP